MFDLVESFFGGIKTWFYEFFIDGLLIALWNWLVGCLQYIIDWGLGQLALIGGPDSMTFQVTGLSGWIAEQMNFAACITVVLNAYLIKWLFRKIPFLKW